MVAVSLDAHTGGAYVHASMHISTARRTDSVASPKAPWKDPELGQLAWLTLATEMLLA